MEKSFDKVSGWSCVEGTCYGSVKVCFLLGVWVGHCLTTFTHNTHRLMQLVKFDYHLIRIFKMLKNCTAEICPVGFFSPSI